MKTGMWVLVISTINFGLSTEGSVTVPLTYPYQVYCMHALYYFLRAHINVYQYIQYICLPVKCYNLTSVPPIIGSVSNRSRYWVFWYSFYDTDLITTCTNYNHNNNIHHASKT